MLNQVISWFRGHASAILGTAIAVSKAGVVGKTGSAILAVIVAACDALSTAR